ncbi:MAG: retropepsin-like aspartic protease, partial [Owenweeksia sp.]
MRIFIPVCLILMLFAGCGTLKNMDYFRIRQRSKIISTNFHKEHSFRENRPLIIIPVEIRGKTYDFIFDTGAASTVISRELANELG